jgi:site-specific recombinase XerD
LNDIVKKPSIILSDRLQELVRETKDYMEHSQSDNTIRSYVSDWKHFVSWCQSNSLPFLPAPDFVVALYITELAKTRKVSTISRRLLAIKAAHLDS